MKILTLYKIISEIFISDKRVKIKTFHLKNRWKTFKNLLLYLKNKNNNIFNSMKDRHRHFVKTRLTADNPACEANK